jgi:cyanophycinase
MEDWMNSTVGDLTLPNGSLFLLGGGMEPAIVRRFFDLAGGLEAPVVVIPTALGDEVICEEWTGYQPFEVNGPTRLPIEDDGFIEEWPALGWVKWVGASNVTLIHTRDREMANTESFAQALRGATGVFFTGGNAERITDVYRDTLAHEEFRALLDRGGVIGGMSAGAKIQGSYMDSGGGAAHEEGAPGFGFVRDLVALPHCLVWNRQFELIPIIKENPELLGLGLDHDNGVIIRGETLEVIGKSYTTIYDYNRTVQTGYDHEMHFLPEAKFYFLAPGDRFNIRTRQVVENSKTFTEPVIARKWSEL